jgi:glutamate racemase
MLDWGIGGLGCYRLLREARPSLSVLYWSDAGAVAYGKLPRELLRRRVEQVCQELVRRGATRIVVACNAASTVLPELHSDVTLDGVIDHAIAMIPRSLRGTLAVLGGVRTIRSRLYQRALHSPRLLVRGRVAQQLSAHIEAGSGDSKACAQALAHIMSPIAQADGVLLACTHYPAMASAIAAHAPGARLFDPAQALARHTLKQLERRAADGPVRFVTTGDPATMRNAAARAWGLTLPRIEHVALPRAAQAS